MMGMLGRALPGRMLGLASVVVLVLVAGCTDKAEQQGVQDGKASVAQPPGASLIARSGPNYDRIYFDYDSSAIGSEAKWVLERFAALVKAHPGVTFTIEGHCDDHGTRDYNLALGVRRAEAARAALVALGIDPARMHTISYGKERPAVVGENEAAWAQNRRAVFIPD